MMKNMMAMLDQAKHVEREEVCNPKKEIMQQFKSKSKVKFRLQQLK